MIVDDEILCMALDADEQGEYKRIRGLSLSPHNTCEVLLSTKAIKLP